MKACGWRSASASWRRSIPRWAFATTSPAAGLEALRGDHEAPLDETGFCIVADPHDEGTAASVAKWLHLTGRVELSTARPRAPARAVG